MTCTCGASRGEALSHDYDCENATPSPMTTPNDATGGRATFEPTFRFVLLHHVEGFRARLGKSCAKCKRELDPEYWYFAPNSGCSRKGQQYCTRSSKTALPTEVANA